MVETRYGGLMGEFACTYFEDGTLKNCKLTEKNLIHTKIGDLIPKYQITESRTRDRDAVSFYENQLLKSIYLEEPTEVITPAGSISCEFITFYKSGRIHRVFPTYGKVSGTWSEEDEILLTPRIEMNIGNIYINNKLSCICFYESGSVKSISLYPGEIVRVKLQENIIDVRVGISFYENGLLKSIEPAEPVLVMTPIGKVFAYDNAPVGIHGDRNSLILDEMGNIYKVTTVQTGIEVDGKCNQAIRIQAERKRSQLDIEKYQMFAIQVIFKTDSIKIIDSNQEQKVFNKGEYNFATFYNAMFRPQACSSDCSKCPGCGGMAGSV